VFGLAKGIQPTGEVPVLVQKFPRGSADSPLVQFRLVFPQIFQDPLQHIRMSTGQLEQEGFHFGSKTLRESKSNELARLCAGENAQMCIAQMIQRRGPRGNEIAHLFHTASNEAEVAMEGRDHREITQILKELIVRQFGNGRVQFVNEQNDQPVRTIALVKYRFGSVEVLQKILIFSAGFARYPGSCFEVLNDQTVNGFE
jgi:hypothetical protein